MTGDVLTLGETVALPAPPRVGDLDLLGGAAGSVIR